MEHNVTLLTLNAKYVHSSLAVWYLSKAVSQFSRFEHIINVVEATINQPDDDILAGISASKPDILGMSVYIWNARKLETLLKNIKTSLPNTILVLGGPEASYNADYWLSQGADYVIRGEGERSFPLLLDALADGDFSEYNACSETADIPIVDPYTDAYFSALKGRIAYLETSRGCPFRCSFCLSGGSRLRFFPLDKAKEQILKLSQSGARTIKLVDRTFNCNADRAYELFEYVISLDAECCFHFEVAADLFDERTLALLRTARPGRIQLEAGLQSFHEPTLNAVARQTSLEKAEQNLKTLLDGRNIHIHIDLIAGLPLETLADFRQSFNRAYALGAHILQLGFLKLLHGSALREQADELGLNYCKEPPYEILNNPWLSAEDMNTIRQAEHALQRVYNSGRFVQTVRYVLSATGMPPFELYQKLGASASGFGLQLGEYAERIHTFFSGLSGVDDGILRDNLICDWLCSMRGKNMPAFLRKAAASQVAAYAERCLGRKIERCEAAVLWTNEHVGVFIDSKKRDPVTSRFVLCGSEVNQCRK